MVNEKMNQFLRDRKIKNKKVASYRKNRIVKHYHKLKDSQDFAKSTNPSSIQIDPNDEGAQRKIKFYQQVFSQKSNVKTVQLAQRRQPQKPIQDESIEKLGKLKQKKEKYIRKMQKEKTGKGQPVMRNYIKYALAKLQETLERQKKK